MIAFLLWICAVNFCEFSHASQDCEVTGSALGRIRGWKDDFSGVCHFWKIPFGEAPVGKLRLRSPEPKYFPKTDEPQVFDASPVPTGDDFCLQGLFIDIGTEDCLWLELTVPPLLKKNGELRLRPVILKMFGTGHQGDVAEMRNFSKMSLNMDALVTDIRYRLGLHGWLADDRLRQASRGNASGNWGIMDQQLGLRWLKLNTFFFGGDPMLVSFFVCSSAGVDLCIHLVAETSRGLFQRAWSDGGPCDIKGWWRSSSSNQLWRMWDPSPCEKYTQNEVYLECIQDNMQSAIQQKYLVTYFGDRMRLLSGYVDGAPGGLEKLPSLAIQRGEVSNTVPIVCVNSRHETSNWYVQPTDNLLEHGFLRGTVFPYSVENATMTDFRGLLDTHTWTTFCDRDWEVISNSYRLEDYDNNFGWMLADVASDAMTKSTSFFVGFCGMERSFGHYAKATGESVFFAYIHSIGSISVAPHTISEAYLAQTWPNTIAGRPLEFQWPTKADLTIARRFTAFARNFAHVGAPTLKGEWKPYEFNKRITTISGVAVRFDVTHPRYKFCTLWDSLQLPKVAGAACPTVSPTDFVFTPSRDYFKCLGAIMFFCLACAGSIFWLTTIISYDKIEQHVAMMQ